MLRKKEQRRCIMRLIDLEPKWLLDSNGWRVGFIFKCPTKPEGNDWQTCMFVQMSVGEQVDLWEQNGCPDHRMIQACKQTACWTIENASIAEASFENLTIKPSIDGSAAGNWHGHIQNGEIVGGMEDVKQP